MTARPAAQRAPWLVLAIVSLPVFIGALDLTIISAVLPEVIVSLDLPVKEYLDQASWAVSGYLLAYAISMTFAGRLSDLFGRRAVYITCLLIFMAGSYLVTTYDSPTLNSAVARFYRQVLDEPPPRLEERYLYLVIFGRVVQAFGAGAMVPVTIALAGDLFPPERRARPLGVVGAVDTLGWVLGHLYGGVMVRLFGQHGDAVVDAFAGLGLSVAKPSWETLFLLNIPVSALALIGAWWALRGIHRPRRAERFDVLGTLFLTLALIGLNLGLGTNPETASTAESFEDLGRTASHYGPALLVGAALAFLLFLLVEARASHPLIRLGMFRSRNVSASSLTNFLVGFCLAIGLVSAPLLVNFRMDSPTSKDVQHAAYTAGLLLSGLTVPMALAAIPGGWLSERFGYRLPTASGLLVAGIGFALTSATWESDTSYWLMGAQMAIVGVGLGLTISPVGTAVLNDVTESERGIAAALILVLRLVGMTVAISSLTIYALDRFDVLVAERMASAAASLEETVLASQTASLEAAVDVISELQFIGAAATLIALVAALLMRGGRAARERVPLA
ncbi:MAG: MFS transporter [Chloroflexota bacterium]